jgi:hypothetical protein
VQVSEPFFPEYEAAVESFLHAGGHEPTLILSPPAVLRLYRTRYPGLSTYTNGVPIEEAPQDYVSVSGTTIGGRLFQWPEQDQ